MNKPFRTQVGMTWPTDLIVAMDAQAAKEGITRTEFANRAVQRDLDRLQKTEKEMGPVQRAFG